LHYHPLKEGSFMEIRKDSLVTPAMQTSADGKGKVRETESSPAAPGDTFTKSARDANATFTAENFYSIPTPMEMTPQGKKIMYPEKRIDAVREVLEMQKVWDEGITGKGVTIAVVDTGIYPHPDIKGRILAFKDFVNGRDAVPYDDNGHGTHVAGCAAGSGEKADGHFKGPAPEANLVGVKVLSGQGSGSMAGIIKGIQWVIDNKDRYNIKVMNLSLGGPANLKEKDDLVSLAIKRAADAGIVPLIAAGNSGPMKYTIGTPAICSEALTVGAYDDKNTANKSDDTMAFFSSRGPTTRDGKVKPDIASPGVQIVSLRSPGSMIDKENVPHLGDYYVLLSGTSMATPVMAGVIADMIQANPNLTPAQVKEIAMKTARPLNDASPTMQGMGLTDPYAAVQEAKKRAAEKPDK
jgi:serine protease AprX